MRIFLKDVSAKKLDSTFILADKDEKLCDFIFSESNQYDVNTYLAAIGYKVVVEDRMKVAMLQVAKKVLTPTYAEFSIKKIECKNCGGSFDGSHQRISPFCHRVYDMKDESWVITKILNPE